MLSESGVRATGTRAAAGRPAGRRRDPPLGCAILFDSDSLLSRAYGAEGSGAPAIGAPATTCLPCAAGGMDELVDAYVAAGA